MKCVHLLTKATKTVELPPDCTLLELKQKLGVSRLIRKNGELQNLLDRRSEAVPLELTLQDLKKTIQIQIQIPLRIFVPKLFRTSTFVILIFLTELNIELAVRVSRRDTFRDLKLFLFQWLKEHIWPQNIFEYYDCPRWEIQDEYNKVINEFLRVEEILFVSNFTPRFRFWHPQVKPGGIMSEVSVSIVSNWPFLTLSSKTILSAPEEMKYLETCPGFQRNYLTSMHNTPSRARGNCWLLLFSLKIPVKISKLPLPLTSFLFLHVGGFLSVPERVICFRVCSHWYNMISHPKLWRVKEILHWIFLICNKGTLAGIDWEYRNSVLYARKDKKGSFLSLLPEEKKLFELKIKEIEYW